MKPNNFVEGTFTRRITSGERALTETQVEKLMSVINKLDDIVLLKLTIAGGFRREDIVCVKIPDINKEENSITFYEHKKGATHKIYLSPETTRLVEMLIAQNKTTFNNNDYLFPTNYGSYKKKTHISSRKAYNVFQKYLKRAGIEPRPFHSLRATCVKLCQVKGWTAEQTAKHLNDSIRVIQQHYSTPSSEEQKSVAENKPLL